MIATICDICKKVCERSSESSLELYCYGDKDPTIRYDLCTECASQIMTNIDLMRIEKGG